MTWEVDGLSSHRTCWHLYKLQDLAIKMKYAVLFWCNSTIPVYVVWSFVLFWNCCPLVSRLAFQLLLQCFSIYFLTCPCPSSLHLFLVPSLVCLDIIFALPHIISHPWCSLLMSWSPFPHVATQHSTPVFCQVWYVSDSGFFFSFDFNFSFCCTLFKLFNCNFVFVPCDTFLVC